MSWEKDNMSKGQIVTAVRLRYNPKAFWFDPVFSTYQTGDHVLVDTERGREVGLVVEGALEVTEKQIKELKTPLKPVIRAVTELDYDHIDELDAKGKAAMPVFRELIGKHQLDMKPVSVEFLFTGDKAVFYFSNDERVDFRELVRDLAAHFRVRVDMRQIGVRDEARILGGLAHCGEELCCARLGGEFQPVSIRIAKEQDLPLNPSKISGACGRLMCCLRYEFEAYKDFKNRAPKRGALIETPIGQAKVVDFDTPREVIIMRLEDGKQLSIPLCEFQCRLDEDGKKHPCSVSKDTINRCTSSGIMMALASLEQEFSQGSIFEKGEFEPGDGGIDNNRTVRRPRRSNRQTLGESIESMEKDQAGVRLADTAQASRPQQQQQTCKQQQSQQARAQQQPQSSRQGENNKKSGDRQDDLSFRKRNTADNKGKPRPGQHSSALRKSERNDPLENRNVDRLHEKTGKAAEPVNERKSARGDRKSKELHTEKVINKKQEKRIDKLVGKDSGEDDQQRPTESFRRRWRGTDTQAKQ